ncbi:MAG TPA: SUMF1/EgtB/PvdO family nonheme iron enzyme, partial [Candidatus Paceibacterota bacterium]|nr:SUMF1/EgtB/PvdO family nonheme iron enzyme [Candidatus Paceibacterota bacterium]
KKKLSGGSQRTLSVALSSLSLAELLIAQALYARRPRPVRTRLPERIQWEYAAKGGNESRWYPWGTDPIPTGFQDATAAYANYNCLGDGSPETDCALTDILPVGSKPAGMGKFGQLDLAGSMREWTLDSNKPYPASCDDCANLSEGAEKVVRGGDWSSASMYLASDVRLTNIPEMHYKFAGVRCARAR